MKTQTARLCAVRRQGGQPAYETPGRSGMGLGVADHLEPRTWVRLGTLDKDGPEGGIGDLAAWPGRCLWPVDEDDRAAGADSAGGRKGLWALIAGIGPLD